MSQGRLKDFLEKLSLQLEKSSEEYRRGTTNRKYTVFTYKASTIRKVLRTLLNSASNFDADGAKIMKEVSKKLTPRLSKLTTELRTKFERIAVSSKGTVRARRIRGGIEVRADKIGNRDNFALMQRTYKESLDKFYEDFLDILESEIIRPSNTSKDGEVNVGAAGQAFNLEHLKGKSNIQDFINDSIFEALKDVYDDTKVSQELEDELKNLGFNNILKVIKNAEKGIIEVFIGSQILNALESKKEKAIKAKLEKDLKKAIKKLEGIENLSGSDSLAEGVRKKYIKASVKPFEKVKSKDLKVTSEDYMIKESRPEVRTKKVKVTRVKARGVPLKKKKPATRKAQGSNISSFALIGIINDRLPETLQRNMQSPALNYRTGRFANSVRVLDAAQTRQGYTSFGYTYQKSPYQTFERGYGQGTPDRDPRRLIDRSIREIAAQYALGRFFTRRL
jgi:hypothetical protein